MNKNAILNTKIDFAMLLAIFVAFKPSFVSYFSGSLNAVWYAGQIVGIGCIFCYLMKKKPNIVDVLVALFYIWLLLTTVIHKGAIPDYGKEVLLFSSLYLTMRYGVEKNPVTFFGCVSALLLFYTLVNTATAIVSYPGSLFRDNQNPIFFLGGDNSSVSLYLACICFCAISKYQRSGKLSLRLIPLVNLLIFSVVRDLGGGKVVFGLTLLGLAFLALAKRPPKKTALLILGINVALFLCLVIFNRIDFLQDIIVNVLNRDTTLTDRTVIWGITIDKIIASPLTGYGMIDGLVFQSMLPYIIGINAHNTYLMMLFDGGVALFGVFAALLVVVASSFDSRAHPTFAYVFAVGLFAQMIRAQIEGWDVQWIFIYLSLMFLLPKIESSVMGHLHPERTDSSIAVSENNITRGIDVVRE